MKITWDNIDDFKLTKRGNFNLGDQKSLVLIEGNGCSQCSDPYFTSNKLLNKGKGLSCSRECSIKSRITGLLVSCFWCDKEIYRKLSQTERDGIYFCCHDCHVETQKVSYGCGYKDESKYINDDRFMGICIYCGGDIKNNNLFCSNQCNKDYEYLSYINKWKLGIVDGTKSGGMSVSQYIRKYLWLKYNNRCSRCGWDTKNPYIDKLILEIEHIDGDSINNKEENLDLICPNCHSLTSTYKALNIGNGNKLRLKYYKLA